MTHKWDGHTITATKYNWEDLKKYSKGMSVSFDVRSIQKSMPPQRYHGKIFMSGFDTFQGIMYKVLTTLQNGDKVCFTLPEYALKSEEDFEL